MTETPPNQTETVVSGWAGLDPSGKVTPFIFQRRENGPEDVTIKILYCGMCHSDLHYLKNDWGITVYPVVPGHEITGEITKVGKSVSRFKVGDRVGVGCLAASCMECEFCKDSEENYCDQVQFTYNGVYFDGSTTYGGYSDLIVSHQRYVVRIPDNLPLDAAAPLLCAGITVYSPMKQNDMLRPGKKLGVVGLGGLGHVAVKFGKAFGLHVTVISTSPSKEEEAKQRLGADDFLVSKDPKQMKARTRSLDFIIDTVSAHHSLGPILNLLKVNGTLVLVGAPDKPVELPAFPLIFGKQTVKGSMIGGMRETQEMMDLCGKHNITCDIELVSTKNINDALDRLARNDVRYRFVIDIAGSGGGVPKL
ncbi:putative cinnamyl alcohol dehydrogenase 6 [Acorus gramineus]|uniref:cinnamyl-alcohol dehydrogenase n=1 Tax=Acorus gramineus TaxID=55184 RepID=A0AAV9AF44_ACOGR|nr:putative cinnamyl alcohol dehydrogenase 6 [Acorus gramineus]